MQTILVVLLIAVDRVLKIFAETTLSTTETKTLIPGILGLRLLEGGNQGAAFGILSGSRVLLSVFSVICIMVLTWILYRRPASSLARVAVVLILAGAIGNAYDRIVYGRVTDYLVLLFMDFPIFNFADCLVDVGTVILIILILRMSNDQPFFEEVNHEQDA